MNSYQEDLVLDKLRALSINTSEIFDKGIFGQVENRKPIQLIDFQELPLEGVLVDMYRKVRVSVNLTLEEYTDGEYNIRLDLYYQPSQWNYAESSKLLIL